MISIENVTTSQAVATADRSVVSLGLLGSVNQGKGLSGVCAVRPVRRGQLLTTPVVLGGFGEREQYLFPAAAAPAGTDKPKHTTQHPYMWAFRGLPPWSDPA